MKEVCKILENLESTQQLALHQQWNRSMFIKVDNEEIVSTLNIITYGYMAPVIITIGIVGDILTVATLTHPFLRRCTIFYTYLTLLAMTDLLTHFSIIPMILWLLDWRLCSPTSAFYYAHIGFPLANALMGASVWIVVFLTLSQYIAICQPFYQGYLRKRQICFIFFVFSYIFNFCINAPWSTKKTIYTVPPSLLKCSYVVCDRQFLNKWYYIYELMREFFARILPCLLIVYLNTMILITYRATKNDRIKRLINETKQKQYLSERSEQEEKRLFVLLFAIITVFLICTIPAAPLTIFSVDKRSQNIKFQIYRAIANSLEFTKFTLNFYIYCLINPDIRKICFRIILCRKLKRPAHLKGRTVNPVSIYSKSTKSIIRSNCTGLCTAIPGTQNNSSRRSSVQSNLRLLRRANTATNNKLSQHDLIVLKRGNSTASEKIAASFNEISSLKSLSKKNRSVSALFLNTSSLNDSILLFDDNNKKKNSLSFLSPKMANSNTFVNQTIRINDFRPIDKDGNEISTKMLINKVKLDNFKDKKLKENLIITNQFSNIHTKFLNINLKTNTSNLLGVNDSDANIITNNFIANTNICNNSNLLNNDLIQCSNINKPVTQITSSNIIIANTLALLEISKSAERKTSKKEDEEIFIMLPLINNTSCENLKALSKNVLKTQKNESTLLQQEKNFENLFQVVSNAQKRTNTFADEKFTLKLKIFRHCAFNNQIKQNPFLNSHTQVQNLISIAANASNGKNQKYLTESLNTDSLKSEEINSKKFLSFTVKKNSDEITLSSVSSSPTISLTQLSLKNDNLSFSQRCNQRKQTGYKFSKNFTSSPIRRAINCLTHDSLSFILPQLSKQSYDFSSNNVKALTIIAKNALKSSNKDTCSLDE